MAIALGQAASSTTLGNEHLIEGASATSLNLGQPMTHKLPKRVKFDYLVFSFSLTQKVLSQFRQRALDYWTDVLRCELLAEFS